MGFCIEFPGNHYITSSPLNAFLEAVEEALELVKKPVRVEVAAFNTIFSYSQCYKSFPFHNISYLQSAWERETDRQKKRYYKLFTLESINEEER